MMKSRIPVTVTNVACELFNEAYNKSIKGLYHIKYDCFKENLNYSAYVWAKQQTSCDIPADINCLVKSLYRTYEPCDRTPTEFVCGITTTITSTSSSCASNMTFTITVL